MSCTAEPCSNQGQVHGKGCPFLGSALSTQCSAMDVCQKSTMAMLLHDLSDCTLIWLHGTLSTGHLFFDFLNTSDHCLTESDIARAFDSCDMRRLLANKTRTSAHLCLPFGASLLSSTACPHQLHRPRSIVTPPLPTCQACHLNLKFGLDLQMDRSHLDCLKTEMLPGLLRPPDRYFGPCVALRSHFCVASMHRTIVHCRTEAVVLGIGCIVVFSGCAVPSIRFTHCDLGHFLIPTLV
jgi:hypothetical protein